MTNIFQKSTQIPPDWLSIKKVLAAIGLFCWIATVLGMLLDQYLGLKILVQDDTKLFSFYNPFHVVLLLSGGISLIVLICLLRNVATYITAIWLIPFGILTFTASFYQDDLLRQSLLTVISIACVWLAFDLVMIRWNSYKKEGNEDPVEEKDKMLSKVAQEVGDDQVKVVCL